MAKLASEPKTCPLGTWVTEQEGALFAAICAANGVRPSVYLRALVVDCIAEEAPKIKTVIPRKVLRVDLFASTQQSEQQPSAAQQFGTSGA